MDDDASRFDKVVPRKEEIGGGIGCISWFEEEKTFLVKILGRSS